MSKAIPLHPKGFLNPTMAECIICGQVKPFLAFLGSYYDGVAPLQMVIDPNPCRECFVKYGFDKNKATLIIEAKKEKNKPVITGRVCVADRSHMKRLFDIDDPIIYLEPDDYCMIIQPKKK